MTSIGNFPSLILRFDSQSHALDRDASQQLRDFVREQSLDDLIVLSHGWNNSERDAMKLYGKMGTSLDGQVRAMADLHGRKIGIAAVIWPSKALQFFEKSQAAGGIPSPEAELAPLLDTLAEEPEADGTGALRKAAERAAFDRNELSAFLSQLRRALRGLDGAEDADTVLFGQKDIDAIDIENHYDDLDVDDGVAWEDGQGGAAGATGRGFAKGVGDILNKATYYLMKRRAGHVGQHGVAEVLREIRSVSPDLRIHLVGHSFGARLVTAATLAIEGDPSAIPDSLCLIQAAFSQNSFSATFPKPDGGFFREIIARPLVDGPIVVTHTVNDLAVLTSYALASALAGHDASFTDSANDLYGGLGAHGARRTREAISERLREAGGVYRFRRGLIFNLLADDFIKDHSDIDGAEVAYMIASLLHHGAS